LPDRATQIEVNDQFSCVLVVPGKRVCWGGPHGSSLVVDTRWQIARLARGRPESCVITTGGQLVCEGNNVMGRLGFPGSEKPHEETAKPVPGLSGVRDAFLATDFGCALVGGGHALCWGNGFGCSGPMALESSEGIESFGGGDGLSCFVRADGSLAGIGEVFEMGLGRGAMPICRGGVNDSDTQLHLFPILPSGVLNASRMTEQPSQ
jgi:hypothetical protein